MENNKKETKLKNSGMHIASFVLGIISIFTALFWYITLPTGVLAVIFGVKASKRTGSKLAKTGMILGIIGLSIFAFIYISMIILIILNNTVMY